MSQDPPKFPEGLPVGFFHEDPEERRQRIEGARPPLSTVVLPWLEEPGGLGLEYRLIQFPWEPVAGRSGDAVTR
jgi:hypothetical protein